MKRILIASLLAALAAPFGAFSQSWDLSLESQLSATRVADLSLSATETANFSLLVPLGSSLKFSTKLMAKYAADYTWQEGLDNSNPLSLQDVLPQEFQLQYGAPFADEGIDQLTLQLGRFPYADPSGAVFSNKLDGLHLNIAYPALSLWALFGYTGYLPQSDDSFVMGAADYVNGTDGYGPPRAIASFGVKTKKIAGIEFYTGLIAQEDLRNDDDFIEEYSTDYDPAGSGAQDSAYLTAGASGAVGGRGLYSAYGVYEFGRALSYLDGGYNYKPVKAWSAGASFRYAFPPKLTATARILYGSGDSDADASGFNTKGDATFFSPITKSSPGLVFAPQAGNLAMAELGVNFVPNPTVSIGMKALQIGAKVLVFMKAGEGPMSEGSVDTEAGFKLLGIEEDTTLTLKLLSDFTFNLSAGLFLPFVDPMGAFPESYTEDSPLKFTVRAGVTLAL
jgi:hypothetical protein